MKKLVYLFELDSTCNSEKEIASAQHTLFKEILFKGNKVVLSYNQLSDSKVFFKMIENDKIYEYLIELFKLGCIKISQYRKSDNEEVRTASQYIQAAIKKCKAEKDNKNAYIFSVMPVSNQDEELDKIEKSLQYSDITILEDELKNIENKLQQNKIESDKKDVEKEKLRWKNIIKYIKMILLLSTENLAKNGSVTYETPRIFEIIEEIISFYHGKEVKLKGNTSKEIKKINLLNTNNNEECNLLNQATKILSEIYDSIKNENGKNNRSFWIRKIEEDKKSKNIDPEKAYLLAELIVDLCYNYTVEMSIRGIYIEYALNTDANIKIIRSLEFKKNFEKRLIQHFIDYEINEHIYNQNRNNSEVKLEENYLKNEKVILESEWNTAVRILKETNRFKINDKIEEKLKNEEKIIEKEWLKVLIRYFVVMFSTTFSYILLYFFTENIINKFQDIFLQSINSTSVFLEFGMQAIFSILLFGILGSLVSKFLKLPDILESIQNIWYGFKDLKVIFKFYRNLKKEMEEK